MKYVLCSVLICYAFNSHAQQIINGTVRSLEGILPGANILIEGTSTGAVADKNGQFKLELPPAATYLVVSFIGYKSQRLLINNQKKWDIVLEVDVKNKLNEIVITALSKERKKTELGYAIQKIDDKKITAVPSVNFLDNIAGKLAGVQITNGSATGVGSSSKIVIRGEQSFTNNNPLFIIDGVPINNNTDFNITNEAATGFQEVDFGNGVMGVNQQDIASVTVLKGPSGAALYGTRAANGVIIITTKEATKQGLYFSFNTSLFVDRAFRLPKFQNQFGQGNNEQFTYVDGLGAGTNDNITYSWGPRLDQGLLINQFDSPVTLADGTTVRAGDTQLYGNESPTPTPFVSHPNNLKNFYQIGITTINNIAVSNRTEKGNVRLSLGSLNSKSIIPGVDLKRKNIGVNALYQVTNKLSVGLHINYINAASENRPSNGYGSENVNYSLVAWGPRSLDINALKNYWQPGLEGRQQFSFNYTFFDNPYFILKENRNSFERNRIFGNVYLNFEINDYLSLRLRSAIDHSREDRFYLRNFSTNRFKNGAYATQGLKFQETNNDLLLQYQKEVNDFSINISFGGNRMRQTVNNLQIQTTQLSQPGIFSFNNAASPIEAFDFSSEKRINSLYGLASFGYKQFLFLDITGRNDWSSALATPNDTGNTSFFYPSVATNFVLSKAIDLPKVISLLQLRTSYAQVGNDTNPYQTSSVFVAQTNVNGAPTFSNQNFIPNNHLKPEITTAFEVGTTFNLFNDRLSFDFNYYNSSTKDQIISRPIPVSSGYEEQVVNGGEVQTKGFEAFMGLILIDKKQFSWKSQFNFNSNQSIIKNLPEEESRVTLAYSRIYNNPDQTVWFQVEKGGRIGDFYGTGYMKNKNGDFIINGDGNFIADPTLKKLGNYNPDFTLGLDNQFAYKNWGLEFLFDWKQGGQIVSRTLSLAGVGGQLEETADRPNGGIIAQGVVNTGSAEDPVWTPNTKTISAESYYRQFYDRNHEENNVYDASYLKLRQFAISYQGAFKSSKGSWLKRDVQFKLSLIGRNLFAWSAIPHFDPEQLAVQGNQLISGVEDLSYASTRSFGFKLGVDF